jgi:hypothetical protein
MAEGRPGQMSHTVNIDTPSKQTAEQTRRITMRRWMRRGTRAPVTPKIEKNPTVTPPV